MLAAGSRRAAARAPVSSSRSNPRRPLAVFASSSSSSSSSPSYRFDAIDAEWHALPKPGVQRATAVRRGASSSAASTTTAHPPAVSEVVERLNAAFGIYPQHQREVFIITFGGGAGVYTLSSSSSSSSSSSPSRETVLAFEASDDAERYATLLEAVIPEGGPQPSPEVFALPRADVDAFCAAGGYALRLHPSSSTGAPLLLPPEATLRLMFDLEELRAPAEVVEVQVEEKESRRWSSSA